MTDRKPLTAYPDGRDEMNLADFPISVLDSHQPKRIDGGKVDTVAFEATRYDPVTKRRLPQRVTLLTNSQIGLPTPTDENVVLGLLCLAKESTDFQSPRVHFTPHALISILQWAPTGKNYRRLRDSLRRLKALTIRYENAWWDRDGRQYQSEFSTGIISEYFVASQVRGRRKADAVPENFVVFAPKFFESLHKGNLKRLDLATLFSLKLPTSQRLYRFLDKRFYHSPSFEMDLTEFACGHIGVSPTKNVAHLKQRLNPPIEELEGIGFLSRTEPRDRYRNVSPKVWRIQLQQGSGLPPMALATALADASPTEPTKADTPIPVDSPEDHLIRAFYQARFDTETALPITDKERDFARTLFTRYGPSRARAVVNAAAEIVKAAWPEGKTLLAIMRYLPEAEAALAREERKAERQRQTQTKAEADREQQAEQAKVLAVWKPHWESLAEAERDVIRCRVLASQPKGIEKYPRTLERMCLLELAKQEASSVSNVHEAQV